MTKKLALVLPLIVMLVGQAVPGDVTGQTFFMPRSTALDVVQQHALNQFRIGHAAYTPKEYRRPVKRAACNLTTSFFHQETDQSCVNREYFLFGGKGSLLFDEQGNGDVGSEWLGLFAIDGAGGDFSGKFTIKPERTVTGVTFNYYHDLSELFDGAWISVFVPVVHVTHDLNPCESDVSTTVDDDSFKTIGEAMNNPGWRYGKWSPCKLSKSGVDDMHVKAGAAFVNDDRFRLDLFISALFPLGEKPTGEYVFEPMVGAGSHYGVGGGASFELDVLSTQRQTLSWFGELQLRYLLSGKERRSFDIKERPWSRYLFYREDGAPIAHNTPGINLFTREIDIKPGMSADLLTSLHYRYSVFNIEAGYRYWWRDAETLDDCTPTKWPTALGITASVDPAGFLPNAEIGNEWPETGDAFSAVAVGDLDLNVATHKEAKTHTIFAAASVNAQVSGHPTMLGFGGSYEFVERNTAFDMWSVWGSMSIGF